MLRGFRVVEFIMDGQFQSVKGYVEGELQCRCELVARGIHAPEVERYIRTVKDRVRCVYNTLPYAAVPIRMLIEMVYYANFWLNCFPRRGGVSKTLGSRTLVTGKTISYDRHCRLELGAYCQVHEEHNNTMATRAVGALALRPTGNEQGSYYFLSLLTGRVLNRQHWTNLPISTDVIDRVNRMARQQKAMGDLVFTDMYDTSIPDPDPDGGDLAGVNETENENNNALILPDAVLIAHELFAQSMF